MGLVEFSKYMHDNEIEYAVEKACKKDWNFYRYANDY